ncbi:MAG: M48 family metalloprotease [Desulfobulbaceae bacterium]|jgi:Zn-dependent protease with chaperone function|nr:M48 family metalloprotease [Desulfobulbaceae bacterium]
MDFFARQDTIEARSRRMITLFAVALALILITVNIAAELIFSPGAKPDMLAARQNFSADGQQGIGFHLAICCITLLMVGLPAWRRFSQLASYGGDRIAQELAALPVNPDSAEPDDKRLINVSQEMAITAGIPMPSLHILTYETGINAMAAGHDFENAAIIVSQGALKTLSRDQLQGVIAHEFTHIQNGDMRLNMLIIALLHGLLFMNRVGKILTKKMLDPLKLWRERDSELAAYKLTIYTAGFLFFSAAFLFYALGSDNQLYRHYQVVARPFVSMGGLMRSITWFGCALLTIGLIGSVFARLIRAGVSRQREFLADVSAVRLTRNLDGIVGALKKIGGFTGKSNLRPEKRDEVSHMLFVNSQNFADFMATHPPIAERIQALEEHFVVEELPEYQEKAGFAAASAFQDSGAVFFSGAGGADGQHIHESESTSDATPVPDSLLRLSKNADDASLLLLALLFSQEKDPESHDKMLRLVWDNMGNKSVRKIQTMLPEARRLSHGQRQLLLRRSAGALNRLPDSWRQDFLLFVEQIIARDRRTSAFEVWFLSCLRQEIA